ncbi:macrolide family glycosyltransferase [Streptantibioticus silvisoli]|uniref:Glycosyltransferase n=1 Tax=Streptantibioticus silvisoli TaxID=2705255 RepID=A0ABT6VS58_9ACTN|nr:macrolide family glycosyltransferase [Streptantibioticus silvisoli]MDI5961306.1 glycosyltransferase [Streptantibioticus silvisoli]
MPGHILVLTIPAQGHMRPALAVTEELVRRGHRVSFLTPESFEPAVKATGATAIRYESLLTEALGPGQYKTLTSDLLAWSAVLFLQESTQLVALAQELFAGDLPDLVLYDMIVAPTGRALEQLWDRPAVQSTPSMASNANYSQVRAVQLRSGVPDEHPAVVELLSRAEKFAADLGINASPGYLVDWGADKSVVYAPREFQPFGETFGDETTFVGPCLSPEYTAQTWQAPGDGLPLVIISMGTLYNHQPDFFPLCVRAFEGQPWHAVITVGNGLDPDSLGPLPPNVEVLRWIPQLAAVREADVFVTAAGLGSLMESLYAGTPPVLVPQVPETRVLSDRAVELGLGTLLNAADITEETLLSAVRRTAADEGLRERVRHMAGVLERAGGAARAAEALEARLP